MKRIQMVDLQSQYAKIKDEVEAAMAEVMASAAFINGPQVQEFASNLSAYLGVRHTIPCANGTDALQIAMMALNLQPGDEVITPSFTYVATAEVVALLKLKPVFVDVDPHSFLIDPEQIRKAVGPRTKAIVPVHLFGQAAHMEPIMQIASEYGLHVIEDNAQAIGCDYRFSDGKVKKTGTIGHIGCTSFFPSKNLGGSGDGGALFTNDDELAARLRMIANHGQKERYYHEVVGCNSRLDSLQAALLNIKLKRLDAYNEARNRAAAYYDQAFAGHEKIQTPVRVPHSNHVFHQYTLILEGADRNGLQQFLAGRDIPSMIYYPVPCHKQNMFAGLEARSLTVTNSDWLSSRVISLPMHTELDEEQLQYISSSVLEYLAG